MNRWIWMLILSLTLGITACGKKEEQQAPAQPATPEQPAEPAPQPAEPAPAGE